MSTESSDSEHAYDVIVIGAGPVGQNAAARAVRGGLTACIVEERLVGGECSFWACVPSKALLRPVHADAAARRVRGVRPGSIDPDEVFKRRDYWTSNWHDDGEVRWLDSVPIALVRGHGRLAGEKRVEVVTDDGVRPLSARHAVVLSVGTTPSVPPIDGLREATPWTNRNATESSTVPERLVVLGGGVVAVEMATVYRGLGSDVVLVERSGRLLGRYEEFAGQLLADAMRDAGIEIRLNVSAKSVSRDSVVRVALSDGSAVQGDEILCALGRRPATGDVGLDTVGLEPGKYVQVDDSLRSVDVDGGWLYATGDCNGRALLTHMGKYQGRVAGDVIAARAAGRPDNEPGMRAWADQSAVPQVVFTDPEVCAVGLNSAQAAERGLRTRVVDYDIGKVTGAGLQADDYRGQARLVIDEDRRVVVGATFVGQDMAELVHSATIAVVGEVPLDRLWHAVPSFPSMSEVWLRLLEEYGL